MNVFEVISGKKKIRMTERLEFTRTGDGRLGIPIISCGGVHDRDTLQVIDNRKQNHVENSM